MEGEALSLSAPSLKQVLTESPQLARLIIGYSHGLFAQLVQSAACNAQHSLQRRCARWLLMTADRVLRRDFFVTHDALAQALGVTRPSLSVILQEFQRAGLIDYSRGNLRIVDLAGLAQRSCSCYEGVKVEYDRAYRSA
jgi:CRP-like cAMP-binding protein